MCSSVRTPVLDRLDHRHDLLAHIYDGTEPPLLLLVMAALHLI